MTRKTIAEKIPFFLLGSIFAAITFLSQQQTSIVYNPGEQSLFRVPLILCHNIIFYLYKTVWPVNLSAFYPFPEPMTLSQPMVLAGVIGTCILIPLLLISLRWTRALLAGWLFFFVAIVPTMGVIGFTVWIAANKYMYLPVFGFLMILAFFLTRAWNSPALESRSHKQLGIVMVMLILATLEAAESRAYLFFWQDTEMLDRYMLASAPKSWLLYNELGATLADQKKYDQAIECYHRALQLNPKCVDAYNNLGLSLAHTGRFDEAIDNYHQALRLKSDYVKAYNNMGLAFAAQNKNNEAVAQYQQALQLKPDYAIAHFNLAIVLSTISQIEEAMIHYRQAFQLMPDFAEAHNNLAELLAGQGRRDEAIAEFRETLRINPQNENVQKQLKTLLEK